MEPSEAEGRKIEARRAIEREIGKGFADGGRMLEAVAGAWRGDEDALGLRMRVDDEAKIRRDRVEAGACAQTVRTDAGKMRRDQRIHRRDFILRYFPVHVLRRRCRVELLARDLDAAVWAIDGRKTIDAARAVLQFPDEDR